MSTGAKLDVFNNKIVYPDVALSLVKIKTIAPGRTRTRTPCIRAGCLPATPSTSLNRVPRRRYPRSSGLSALSRDIEMLRAIKHHCCSNLVHKAEDTGKSSALESSDRNKHPVTVCSSYTSCSGLETNE